MTPARTASARMPATAGPEREPTRRVPSPAGPLADNQSMQALLRAGALRAKLEVGGADDPEEREADAMADRVMRSAEGSCCASCAGSGGCDDETLRRAPEAGAGRSGGAVSSATEAGVRRSLGGGHPLPMNLRHFFEPRLGRDLSTVRVHTGAAAGDAARSIGARAFALGSDVAFGAGQYAPDTGAGRRLLAHELAHVAEPGTARRDFSAGSLLDDLQGAADAGIGALDRVTAATKAAASGAFSQVSTVLGSIATGPATPRTEDDSLGSALGSLTDFVKERAVAAANALAKRFGGKVELTPRGLEIVLPSVKLFASKTEELSTLEIGRFIPLLPFGFSVGPLAAEGAVALRLGNPTMIGSLGPGRLENLRLILNPRTGLYMGEGELYIGGAVSESVEAAVEIGLAAAGVIPMEPPLPIVGTIEGGLRAILRGIGKGGLRERVGVRYSEGGFEVSTMTRLQMGGLIELDLEVFLQAMLEGKDVCRLIWPVRELRLAETAHQYELPISFNYRDDKLAIDVGDIADKEIPVDTIETAFRKARPPDECMSLNEIVAHLCKAGKLPKQLCELPQTVVGAAEGLPFPGVPAAGFAPADGATALTRAPIGTEDDPIHMEWYKPADQYPSPIALKFDPEDRAEPWMPYYRRRRRRTPDNEWTIGVTYWPTEGDKLLRKKNRRSGAQQTFKDALEENGYDWGGMEPDHIVDVQFSSPKQTDPDSIRFVNLWPLPEDLNGRAGSSTTQQSVLFNRPSDPPNAKPITTALYNVEAWLGYTPWFIIKNIRLPP